MIIKTKSLLLFNANNFQTKVVFQREHVVSFDCQGIISFKGHVAHISPGEAIVLPKNTSIHIFLYSNDCAKITVYRYYDGSSKTWYTSGLLAEYVNTHNELIRYDLKYSVFINRAIDKYFKLEVVRTCGIKGHKAGVVSKIRQLVVKDLRKDWSVKDICAQVYLSESSLYRTLKSEQTCFTALIQDIRLAYAKELLVTSRLSIGEVSYNSGFNSSSYFGNKFRAKYGMSPTCYRNLIGA
ncbi:helix-turn-helix transcriptional regulator [Vibrio owensii]|uniref:helix-turn-helix transcriptional regulator n=1 Tax=Vibrio owensii TaxID=696485 RepID=UPI00068CB706|nr:AraC family transcriptional regulator [Vibrio owensii]